MCRRWIFYLASIIVAGTGLLMFLIRESHPSQLLDHKVALLQSQRQDLALCTNNRDSVPDLHTFIQLAFLRPTRLFFTEPLVILTSFISAFAFGLLYLLPEALPIIYSSFNFSRQKAMLILLFVALGLALSTLTRFYDRHIARQRRRANLPLCPERKLFGFALAAPLLAVSLWWFAWSVPPKVGGVAWPASAISLILLGYAASEFDTVLAGYLADSYTSYAASAFSSCAFLRAIFSGVFPLFASPLYENLGNNTAGSVFAAIATVFCVVPFVFIKFGLRLRGASRFAKESLTGEEVEVLERVKTEKEERRREEREGMRRMEEEVAAAQGVDCGAMAVVPYF
jgi:ABC-type multidrug transport system fused ATPase/permease subunit